MAGTRNGTSLPQSLLDHLLGRVILEPIRREVVRKRPLQWVDPEPRLAVDPRVEMEAPDLSGRPVPLRSVRASSLLVCGFSVEAAWGSVEFVDVSIVLKPIGFVRTEAETGPRHWSVSEVEGALIIEEGYLEGLGDIEPGQRIVVIFNFHRSPEFSPRFLKQTPPHRGKEMGVFGICSPIRPNPLGMSILEVIGVEGATVHVRGLDMLDGTPILDIKPHVEDRRDRYG